MKLSHLIFIILGFVLISSCSFNKSFYHPDKSPVAPFVSASDHYIKYGDNDSIHALFFEREKSKANLFILHGNGGNLTSWGDVADLFYLDEYQVFIIDFPGFGNSSGNATHKEVIASSTAAVNYFKTLPGVLDQKNIIMGYSLGGNLAIKTGVENASFFDAMILEAPFDTHRSAAVAQVPTIIKFAPFLLTKNVINGKKTIELWTKPLLLIHSVNDQVCPYEMAVKLDESASNTSYKEFWKIKGPHLAGLGMNLEAYLTKMNKLVDQIPAKN